MIESILRKETGKGAKEWMDFIGRTIGKRSVPILGTKGLSKTDASLWLADLARALWKTVPLRNDLKSRDENIICARLMSLILSLWACRIIRAKSYDPRRPIKQRKKALRKLAGYHQALVECLADESRDSEFFSAQEWDCPFSPNARYEPDEMELLRQEYSRKKDKGKGK